MGGRGGRGLAAGFPAGEEGGDVGSVDAAISVDVGGEVGHGPGFEEVGDIRAVYATIAVVITGADREGCGGGVGGAARVGDDATELEGGRVGWPVGWGAGDSQGGFIGA